MMKRIVSSGNSICSRADAVLLDLPGDQVLECDVYLFLFRVALQLDDLHAVAQRIGNGIEHVRRGNEQHLRQIERHVEVVIAEAEVLLRIERLQQRRRRIAAKVASYLVDFVEHENRIVGFRAADALHDLPRQRANVGAAMSADFGLVVHAAQRQAHKLAAQGAGNRLAQRSLAHSRRSDEAQDRALHIRLQSTDRQVIQNPVLHLLQIVMVGIEDLLGLQDIHFLTDDFCHGSTASHSM